MGNIHSQLHHYRMASQAFQHAKDTHHERGGPHISGAILAYLDGRIDAATMIHECTPIEAGDFFKLAAGPDLNDWVDDHRHLFRCQPRRGRCRFPDENIHFAHCAYERPLHQGKGGAAIAPDSEVPLWKPLYEHHGFGGGFSQGPAVMNQRAQGLRFEDDRDHFKGNSHYLDDYRDDNYSDDNHSEYEKMFLFNRGFAHAHHTGFDCPHLVGHGGHHIAAGGEAAQAAATRFPGRLDRPARGGRQANPAQPTQRSDRTGCAVEPRGLSGREGADLQAAGHSGPDRHGMRHMHDADTPSADIPEHPSVSSTANNESEEHLPNITEGMSGDGVANHSRRTHHGIPPLASHVACTDRANVDEDVNTSGVPSSGERPSHRGMRRRATWPIFEDTSCREELRPQTTRHGRIASSAEHDTAAVGVPDLARLSFKDVAIVIIQFTVVVCVGGYVAVNIGS